MYQRPLQRFLFFTVVSVSDWSFETLDALDHTFPRRIEVQNATSFNRRIKVRSTAVQFRILLSDAAQS